MLVLHQTVSSSSQGVASRVTSQLHTVNTPASTVRGATLLDSIDPLPINLTLRPRDFGTATTQSELISAARLHFAEQRPILIGALAAQMRSRGVQSAVFSYDQQVNVAGTSRPKRLVWTLLLDQSARALFGEPQLRDEQPMLLHITYTSRAVGSGLPAEWAYPDAGKLTWQLVNARMQPQGERTQIDTGGAYDVPPAIAGTASDDHAMLQCLMDTRARPSCPRWVPDVRQLINQTGASGAIVDYVQRVMPVYDTVESPPGSGRFEQVARHSMRFDERTVDVPECGAEATYRNRGAYGFLLHSQVDRYAADMNAAYLPINSIATTRLSPTSTFNVNRRIMHADIARIDQFVINPTDPSGPLLSIASLSDSNQVAPVRNGAASDDAFLRKVSSDWRNGRRSAVVVECDRDTGTIRFAAGFALGATPQFIMPRYARFQPGQPGSDYFETREDGHHVPCGATAHYDGRRSIRFEANTGCSFGAQMYWHLAALSPNVSAVCTPGTFSLVGVSPGACHACPGGGGVTYERERGYEGMNGYTTVPVCRNVNSGWGYISSSAPILAGPATITVTW